MGVVNIIVTLILEHERIFCKRNCKFEGREDCTEGSCPAVRKRGEEERRGVRTGSDITQERGGVT